MYLKVGLETPKKEQKLGGKVSEKTSFGVGMELKKVHKQDRVRKPQELQCATSLAGNSKQAEVGLQFLYLLDVEDHLSTTEDAVVHLDTFGSPQRDSACV